MEKSLLEKKIVELEIQLEELCGFYAKILKELMNHGSIVTKGAGVNLSSPIDKLNYLNSQFEKMMVELEKIDAMKDELKQMILEVEDE